MKMVFGMIVLNGNYVLEENLRSIYPYAHQILISEGSVGYFSEKGIMTSDDGTNEIINNFPDPEHKITIVRGQYKEKTEQANAYIPNMKPDADYIWNVDADELWKAEDIEKIFNILDKEQYTSVSVKMYSFYGGFDRYLGGFEEDAEIYRIRKVYPGSFWSNHRPPTIGHVYAGHKLPEKHLGHEQLWREYGVRMYHYSYVFPRQVFDKIDYYRKVVAQGLVIDDYWNQVYVPWVTGNEEQKQAVEERFNGVHEWKPGHRGACRTKPFIVDHPIEIQKSIVKLKEKFDNQLKDYRDRK